MIMNFFGRNHYDIFFLFKITHSGGEHNYHGKELLNVNLIHVLPVRITMGHEELTLGSIEILRHTFAANTNYIIK